MKFSVVLPFHNSAKYLRSAIESVFAQTRPADEVIGVDDSSTDQSRAIVSCFPEVGLITTQARNAAVSRNLAVQRATGEWIAFLDADDLWYPNHLERIAQLVEGSPAVGALNHFDHIDPVSGERHRRTSLLRLSEQSNQLSANDYIRCLEGVPVFVGMSACAVRRSTFEEVGGFDESMRRRHDIELWLRLIDGRRWAFDPTATSAYRRHSPGNLSGDSLTASYYLMLALQKHEHRYPSHEYLKLQRAAAFAAISQALTDGDKAQVQRAWQLAEPYLTQSAHMLLRTGKAAPWLYGALNRWRRRLHGIDVNHKQSS